MMNNAQFDKYTEQAEKLFVAPTRACTKLAVDYTEKLMAAQLEAVRTYSDIGIQQVRAALDIKDPQDLQQYAERQQTVARDLSERVKSDAEKSVAMNQDFANSIRELVESSVKTAAETAQQPVAKARKAAKAS